MASCGRFGVISSALNHRPDHIVVNVGVWPAVPTEVAQRALTSISRMSPDTAPWAGETMGPILFIVLSGNAPLRPTKTSVLLKVWRQSKTNRGPLSAGVNVSLFNHLFPPCFMVPVNGGLSRLG